MYYLWVSYVASIPGAHHAPGGSPRMLHHAHFVRRGVQTSKLDSCSMRNIHVCHTSSPLMSHMLSHNFRTCFSYMFVDFIITFVHVCHTCLSYMIIIHVLSGIIHLFCNGMFFIFLKIMYLRVVHRF